MRASIDQLTQQQQHMQHQVASLQRHKEDQCIINTETQNRLATLEHAVTDLRDMFYSYANSSDASRTTSNNTMDYRAALNTTHTIPPFPTATLPTLNATELARREKRRNKVCVWIERKECEHPASRDPSPTLNGTPPPEQPKDTVPYLITAINEALIAHADGDEPSTLTAETITRIKPEYTKTPRMALYTVTLSNTTPAHLHSAILEASRTLNNMHNILITPANTPEQSKTRNSFKSLFDNLKYWQLDPTFDMTCDRPEHPWVRFGPHKVQIADHAHYNRIIMWAEKYYNLTRGPYDGDEDSRMPAMRMGEAAPMDDAEHEARPSTAHADRT